MRSMTIAAGLIALLLAGCVTPVVLRDPVSGEVTQCLATGAFPLLNQHQCVASHENAGWLRTTGAEAKQAQQQRIAERDAEVAAAREECRAARLRGELKSYAAAAQCSSSRVRAAQKRGGNPFMDLVDLAEAVRLSDAERIDKHQMTEAEATLHTAQVVSQITDQARRRNLETRAVEIQAKTAQTQADAIEVQTQAAQTQANAARDQARAARDQADAAQQQNQLLQQNRLRSPSTTCHTFGNTTSCF
jgi:hypothetical protein